MSSPSSSSAPSRNSAPRPTSEEGLRDLCVQNQPSSADGVDSRLAIAPLDGDCMAGNPESEKATLPADLLDGYAFRLSQFFSPAQGGAEEHPIYTDEEWCLAVEEPVGLREYWCWVALCIDTDKAMWPWDREVSAAVLIARAARVTVEHISGQGWVAKEGAATLIRVTPAPSEIQAWTNVAREIMNLPCFQDAPPLDITETTTVSDDVYRISTQLSTILQPLHDSTVAANFAEGGMRAFERTNSHWVRLCRAAGITVKRSNSGVWSVDQGPDIAELRTISSGRNEIETWRAAAEALVVHLKARLELPDDMWRQKSPTQKVELIHALFADFRPPAPDEATAQHLAYEAKALCLGLGWKVTRMHPGMAPRTTVWQLNQEGRHDSEAAAWLAGADRIRQQLMQIANLSFLDWTKLSVDDRILLAQEHLL